MKRPTVLPVAAATLAVVMLIWWPWEFSIHAARGVARRTAGLGVPFLPGVRDSVTNVLAFIPLGLVYRGRPFAGIWGVGLVAASVAVCIEAGEIFLPARIVSAFDVFFNTVGACIGAVLPTLGSRMLSAFAGTSMPLWASSVLAIAIVTPAFTWLQTEFASLDAWSAGYPLQIGNEATGNRLWCGEVLSMTWQTKERLWTRDDFSFVKETSQVPSEDCDGVWFKAANPPPGLVRLIRQNGEVGLTVQARALQGRQYGPARIVSLSGDPASRNITIAQGGNGYDLIVRIRRRWAGANGTRPHYRLPDVFLPGQPVWITVEANSDSTRISAGGQRLIDRHDVSRQWWILLLGDYEWRANSVGVASAFAFWVILLLPFSSLIGAASAGRREGIGETMATGVLTGVACWGSLRVTGVYIGWESVLLMPLAVLTVAIVSRRSVRSAARCRSTIRKHSV